MYVYIYIYMFTHKHICTHTHTHFFFAHMLCLSVLAFRFKNCDFCYHFNLLWLNDQYAFTTEILKKFCHTSIYVTCTLVHMYS
jgi:hypothetical protein